MQAGKQKMIFIDLLKYIEYLMYREDDLRNCINSIEKKKCICGCLVDGWLLLNYLTALIVH